MNTEHLKAFSCLLSCAHCKCEQLVDAMPVQNMVDVLSGFLLMHRRCEKLVEPSKQVDLFDRMVRIDDDERAELNAESVRVAGHRFRENAKERPAPEIDPPGHDETEQIFGDPPFEDLKWDRFKMKWPQACDAASLAAYLSVVLQHATPPHLFDAIAKHHPSSGTFQAMAHYARVELAHMNRGEHPDLWIPERLPMPAVLSEILAGNAPKKRGARPLSSPAAGMPNAKPAKKKRRSGSTANSG